MEVKTVSAKDAKSSLSKKSPLPKKSLRKALLSPYETIRPICTDSSEIEEIMQRLLSCAKRGNNKIPWSELKQMTEEERKLAKEERKAKNVDKSLRNQLVYGINEVFSAIEKHTLSSAVVCENLEPAFLLNFVLDLATVHNVPMLVVPKLRKLTLDTLGFSCSCLGIKRFGGALGENSFFYPLHQKIVEVVKEFEVRESGILCRCPLKESAELVIDSASTDGRRKMELREEEAADSLRKTIECPNRRRQSYWKMKREKLRKGANGEQTGNESGMAISSSMGDESIELDEGKEGGKALPATASESKDSVEGLCRRMSEAHPYLRTFLSTVHRRKGKKRKHSCSPAESAISSKNGKHAKKSKRDRNSEGSGEVSEGGIAEAMSTSIQKSKVCQYHIQRRGERKDASDLYKSLKLADN